jgi:UDP-2,3-diacylglucosamine pyrophosphatase LpxH
VVGNREVLVPGNARSSDRDALPFTHIAHDELRLHWGPRTYRCFHGDTLNTRDRQYLRWRTICRSRLFTGFFRNLPGPLARKIADRVEASLNHTNREFKIVFPEDEVEHFAAQVLPGTDGTFIGHFHLDREIRISDCDATLRIVPDWLAQRTVLRLDAEGQIERLRFADGQWSSPLNDQDSGA